MAKAVPEKKLEVALVGSETLLGKEIEDVLRKRTRASVTGYAANGEGNFGEAEGEAVYVEALTAGSVSHARVILLAGSPEGAQKAYDLAQAAGGRLLLIDCNGHLERKPEARLVAPLVSEAKLPQNRLVELAHPAASALALVMKRLARYRPLQQVIATIFEPASEQGKRGISELHQQTTSLLSFKPLDKQLFDAQLSFNLLAQYGEEGAAKLSQAEERIERHVASILASDHTGAGMPLPSIRLVGAPVFHGYTFSIWAKFEDDVNAQGLREALASAQIEVRAPDEDAPDAVGVASQSGLIAGDIRIDHNDGHAAWLWVVGDNLRLTADAAAEVVKQIEEQEQR